MEGSWWKSRSELSEEQEAIIVLPIDGKYVVTGPPGCGKTNLLVLRAAYMTKAGLTNLKILTFGKILNRFILTGVVGKGLDPNQVEGYIRWSRRLATDQDSSNHEKFREIVGLEQSRRAIVAECKKIQGQLGSGAKIHQTILVDEVQDLFSDELDVIIGASDRVMLAGDIKQKVYQGGNALHHAVAQLGFTVQQLNTHYRMGHAIAKIADRISEPNHPSESLLATCNYAESKMQSSAELMELTSREEQFDRLVAKLKTQRKAYPRELIGVLVAQNAVIADLRECFAATDLVDDVVFHGDEGTDFSSDKRIHVMTIVAAKGTEFRAVHLYAAEQVANAQDTPTFWYTAVTRAKTSLIVYASPGDRPLSRILKAGFADETQVPDLDSLFDE